MIIYFHMKNNQETLIKENNNGDFMKQIVFDEGHDEAVSIEDTEVSGYNQLAEELKKLGYDVKRTKKISNEDLESADVLVVAFPRREFTTEEGDRIKEFISKGGGLFLLGEWANLHGVADCLNSISQKFGVEFKNNRITDFDDDYGRDEETMKTVLGSGEMPFLVKLVDFKIHPITSDIKSIGFLAGCTLETEPENAIALTDETSFADHRIDKFRQISEGSGPFIVATAKNIDEGRIVCCGDSSTFSNRFLDTEDNKKFGLQIFQWLLGEL
jgi:hypothetical protein